MRYTISYFNDDGEIVQPSESTNYAAQMNDENGELIQEVYGTTLGPEDRKDFSDELKGKSSPEIQKVIDSYRDKDGNYMFRKK